MAATNDSSGASSLQIICVIGPTASGKSALAMALAAAIGGEILAVDSMTVYRGMDIGTAKPSAPDQAAVRHHALNLVEPSESFSVSRFVEHADSVIADCARRGVPLVAVGGTPLYYMSLFKGLFEGPAADESLRDELRLLSPEALHARLASVDAEAAARLHVNDTRRVIRALEVHALTGKSISAQQTEWSSGVPRHKAAWFGLNWDSGGESGREALNRRINARARAMMDAGWLDECRRLVAGAPLSKTAGEAAGYYELMKHLSGRQSLSDAIEQTKINTRQLAKRQIKWFRRFEAVTWLPGQAGVEENLARVQETLAAARS